MPALVPTDNYGRITWLGRVPHRDGALVCEALEEMRLTFAGLSGEAHAGLTRPSCSRVVSQYLRGTEIRNVRQISIVSAEELAEIAAVLELDEIDPAWLGASIVVSGLPDFTHLPPNSRLQGEEGGATLTVDMENQPCNIVSRTIEDARPGHGKGFKRAATGKRGVTAWVEREGTLQLGEQLRLHVPGQRAWAPS
ncbi:MOSC domain-containing protein [Pseudoroseicyclus sp. H15]